MKKESRDRIAKFVAGIPRDGYRPFRILETRPLWARALAGVLPERLFDLLCRWDWFDGRAWGDHEKKKFEL